MSSIHTDIAQLRALLFCRLVSAEAGGATLHEVHDVHYAAEYPTRCADLLLYASFETPRRDEINYEVLVRSPTSRRPHIVHHATAEAGRPRTMTAVIDLRHIVFEAAGRYSFALDVSGLLIGTTTFTVAVPMTTPTSVQ